MGALTLKPLAFRFRPWELTAVTVFNYVEGHGQLVFHLRGGRVMKVTSAGWLKDRTRFCYDGFRRQRLVIPLVNGKTVSWSVALTLWLQTLTSGSSFLFKIDSLTSNVAYLCRAYHLLADGRGRAVRVLLDVNGTPSAVYHGVFGLPAVEQATLALPALLPYEEDKVLSGPSTSLSSQLLSFTVFQLLAQKNQSYSFDSFAKLGDNLVRNTTNSLFQVSPLQRLLTSW